MRHQLPSIPTTPSSIVITPPLPLGPHSPPPGRRAQGLGLGEHSNGWTSVLTCPLVQEAACTPGHGCPRSLYHCPSTVLGNKGRCRIRDLTEQVCPLYLYQPCLLNWGAEGLFCWVCQPGHVGTALSWVVRRAHSLPTFHCIDQRCFCLLGD